MFDGLTGRFGEIFDRLKRRGALSESDVRAALREIRVALLEADVALDVVKGFVDDVAGRATGQEVLKSVTPGQMVVKIVHDRLVELLGGETVEFAIKAVPPAAVLMVGLQGSGKTTTTAKVGKFLVDKRGQKVLMASLDVRRPAAQEQLRVLGDQALVPTLDIVPFEAPVAIAERAMATARRAGYDVVLLDTAGRLAVDEDMMNEAVKIAAAVAPAETLLVADAMTGQDAVNVARTFNERLDLTGIVLSRADGDTRGGAALSMRAETGRPIRLIGVGERLDDLEPFVPEGIAGRILDMGDVVGLVEKAREQIADDEAERIARKLQAGRFDLQDMADQLRQVMKMGGIGGIMGLLPGVAKVRKQLATHNVDERLLVCQVAMIDSMTLQERQNPRLIKASRKRRIAAGSGTTVQEVNKLMKQYQQMQSVMKRMKKMGDKGMAVPGMPGMPGPGMGLPPGAGFR